MNTQIIKANARGHAAHGWLDSWHSFSFGQYHDNNRIHFGALRVLNDDTVSPSMGFGKHPHDNMEIISIPLEGSLQHEDNTGTRAIIQKGEVQVMSAGTGIVHSEKNNSHSDSVKFLQIWIIPNKRNVNPRYDQQKISGLDQSDKLHTIVSPIGTNDGGVQIHQEAWLSMAKLTTDRSLSYEIRKPGNGLYIFLLDGTLSVENAKLEKRDAIAIKDFDKVAVQTETDAEVLFIEVPMLL